MEVEGISKWLFVSNKLKVFFNKKGRVLSIIDSKCVMSLWNVFMRQTQWKELECQ